MSIVEQLKAKLERHEAYYNMKKQELSQLDMESAKWLNRYSRLLEHSTLITKLIIELNTQMAIEVFSNKPKGVSDDMKTRTKEQIQSSKAIYAKHAARYKSMPDEQQDRRAHRMLGYTAQLNKAIAVAMTNRYTTTEQVAQSEPVVKRYEDWEESLTDFLQVGDVVDEGIFNHFLTALPPAYYDSHIVQLGDVYSTSEYGHNMYLTLQKIEGRWTYAGVCHLGSTVHQLR